MLEQKLLDEINRYKSINRNASKHYIMEQEELPVPPAPGDMAPALPPSPDAASATAPGTIEEPESSTEEVDVTDLVSRLNQEKKKERNSNIALSVAAVSAVTVFGIILSL